MTKPKRRPKGHIWACRGADCVDTQEGKAIGIVIVSRGRPTPSGNWTDCWAMAMGEVEVPLSLFRDEHGRTPPMMHADLYDATRREWWCPKCKKWLSAYILVSDDSSPENPGVLWHEPTDRWYCRIHFDWPLTRSRVVLVRRLKLTKDGVKEVKL